MARMRPIWKGALSFGLVNIPVGLYSATSSTEKIKFRLLRASDHSQIRNKRVAEADGKEVPWEEIVKGTSTRRTGSSYSPKMISSGWRSSPTRSSRTSSLLQESLKQRGGGSRAEEESAETGLARKKA